MIAPADYQFMSDLLKKHSGLSLGVGKEYLIESRLPPVAATNGHADIAGLISALRCGASPSLVKMVCDAMTTNETLFFRDSKPFVALEKEFLPAAAARARANGRPVRIWCAASSTGQEPYSIAMIADQAEKHLQGTRVEIVATDYCDAALTRAKEGIYNHFEIQRGLPVQLLMKYFKPVSGGFEVVPALRQRIAFQEINLLSPFPGSWRFDVIFCRNVLIYFDVATKKDVIDRMAQLLTPGGAMFLGGTESTIGITDSMVRATAHPSGVYCRPSDLPLYAAPVLAAVA
jgi:chemotaxis protein methyltransferase CheR